MSTTTIQGSLITLGTPDDSNQPRAMVYITEEQLAAVKTFRVDEKVTIIPTAELAELQAAYDALKDSFAEMADKNAMLQFKLAARKTEAGT